MGDTFGIVISLISIFALLAAIVSALIQAEQMQHERKKARLEVKLDKLERAAFAFRKIGHETNAVYLEWLELFQDQTGPIELRHDATKVKEERKSRIQRLKFSLLHALSEAEILVSAHCPELVEKTESIQIYMDKLKESLDDDRSGFVTSVKQQVIKASEAALKNTIELIRDINRQRALEE